MGAMQRFGGPILYLFISIFTLFGALVWAESGPRAVRRCTDFGKLKGWRTSRQEGSSTATENAESSGDLLRVLDASKAYNDSKVVDNVSFGLPKDTVFALLGPNGAGKTTTFNMIRKPCNASLSLF